MPPGERFPYVVRRWAIAAAFALLLALPAPAGAQDALLTEESCRAAGGSRSMCVGAGKVGERISAECRRRAIVDDETCWSRVGRRVVRAEVADYETSWVHDALGFQYELGNTAPFTEATWVGTHNSANSTSEDPTLSTTDSNQQLTLSDQLRLDVRSLELDVHWTPSAWANGEPAAVLCHARPKGEMHAGCTTERLLADRLPEISSWVAAHEDQVLLLYLEDHINDAAGYASAVADIRAAFPGLIYEPGGGGGCRSLPLALTRAEVLAQGKRVVIVGDCQAGAGPWNEIVFAWKNVGNTSWEGQPRGWDDARTPRCPEPAADMYATRLVRFYEDSTWIATTPAGGDGERLTPSTVREMVECGVDLFGFDQLLPRDGRLEALVWTWGGKGAAARAGECASQGPDARWQGESCKRKYRPACASESRQWTVLAERAQHKGAAAACKDAGLVLGTPRTGEENAALRAAAGEYDTVWLGYSEPGAKKRTR